MIETRFRARDYNQLETVETASGRLEAMPSFDEFLLSFAALAGSHGLIGGVGAFLLHRHFGLGKDEVMVECPARHRNGRRAMITRPLRARLEDVASAAGRWRCRADGSLVPLEFIIDPIIRRRRAELSAHPDFVRSYSQLIREHGLGDVLGLCVADRAYLVRKEGQHFLEVTEEYGSVVTVEPCSSIGSAMSTVWVPVVSQECRSQVRCVPRFVCEPSSLCVEDLSPTPFDTEYRAHSRGESHEREMLDGMEGHDHQALHYVDG